MRILSVIVFLLLAKITLSQSATNFSREMIRITGRINNYVQNNNNGFISFRSYNFKGTGSDTAVQINKDGSFNVILYQPFEGDIAFQFADEFITMYASPGDELRILIDANKFAKNETRPASIRVLGEKKILSKWIIEWYASKNNWEPAVKADWENRGLSDTIFANQRKDQLLEEEKFLDKFIAEKKPPKDFTVWARNTLIYYAAMEISFHCFAGKINRSLHDSALMEILKDFPITNVSAIHCSEYYNYLSSISSDFQIIANINPAYDERKLANGKNTFPICIELADKYAKGLGKELIYYNLFLSTNPTNAEIFFTVFKKEVKDEIIKKEYSLNQLKMTRPFEPVNIISRIRTLKADTSTKERILSVLSGFKTKNVFIDFWGSWCAPCMIEMKYYPDLLDSVKNLPVQFLFLSTDTKNEKVEELQSKFPGNATFINLSNNETQFLTSVFGFNTYPSHFLLDQDGNTVDLRVGSIANTNGLSKFALERIRQKVK